MLQLIHTRPRPSRFVMVIRDPRDASRDIKMLANQADKMFREGKLDYDITNGSYCTKERN